VHAAHLHSLEPRLACGSVCEPLASAPIAGLSAASRAGVLASCKLARLSGALASFQLANLLVLLDAENAEDKLNLILRLISVASNAEDKPNLILRLISVASKTGECRRRCWFSCDRVVRAHKAQVHRHGNRAGGWMCIQL
jgi:hypothetical protein